MRSRRAHRLEPVDRRAVPAFKLGPGQVVRRCSCGVTFVGSEAGAREAHARHVADVEHRIASAGEDDG